MEFFIYVALILFGAALGSFAGATVWRLRAFQLRQDKKAGEEVDKAEYDRLKPLTKASLMKDRSRCLHCGYALRWYDLVPILSWLSLRGKCRHCRHSIGWFELVIELGVAAFFVASYVFWPFPLEMPLDIARFVLWLAGGVVLAMLFAYDAKWYLLPDKLTAVLSVIGVATVIGVAVQSDNPLEIFLNAAGSVGILSGLYLLLYLVSKGQWVGFGDVKLGIGLALLLIDWRLALIALFLANFVGCLIVIPLMIARKLTRTSRVPFGPLLIIGMILAQFLGPLLISLSIGTLI